MKRILSLIIFFALAAPAQASDFNIWKEFYRLAPEYGKNLHLQMNRIKESYIDFDADVPPKDGSVPYEIDIMEFDGNDVKQTSKISRREENGKIISNIIYAPGVELDKGWHLFAIGTHAGKTKEMMLKMIMIDPEVNVPEMGKAEEIEGIIYKLNDHLKKFEKMNYDFTLKIDSKKKGTSMSEWYRGTAVILSKYNYITKFSEVPTLMVNGKRVESDKWDKPFNDRVPTICFRPLPYQPAFYIPFSIFSQNYGMRIHKIVGNRLWLWAFYNNKDLRFPKFIELVVDCRSWMLLEVNIHVYNKEFISATAKIEYNNKNLPIRQTLTRLLPDGKEEVSVLELSDFKFNPSNI